VRNGPLRPEDRRRLVRLPGRQARRDPVAEAGRRHDRRGHRKPLGITPRKISDEEIVQRLVFALVNEGAHILEEGIASRASDIDMVYLTGYGFPLHRGGPMLYADQVGLFNVVQAMKRFQQNPRDDAKFWEPAPLLAKAGRRRQDLQLSPPEPNRSTSQIPENFMSSGLQTIAMAAQRVIAGEGDIYVAGGVESISCVQQEMNTHMLQ
jgi:hypothetical protein